MDSEDEEERGQETYGQNRWHGDLAAVGRLDVAMGLLGLVLYYGARALWPDRGVQVNLVVYGFSTQEEMLTQNIFPAFERSWEAETGRELAIQGVFGPSGTLASQIVLGSPADVDF